MKPISPKKMKNEMKEFLKIAENEPVIIKKKSGKVFYLISESLYCKLADIKPKKVKIKKTVKATKKKISKKTGK
jgi:hypothetical protein